MFIVICCKMLLVIQRVQFVETQCTPRSDVSDVA